MKFFLQQNFTVKTELGLCCCGSPEKMEIDGNLGQFMTNKRQKLNTSSAKPITQMQAGQTKLQSTQPPNINMEFEDDHFQISREEVC